MTFEEKIKAWVIDYLGDNEGAESLKNIIMYHARIEFKRKVLLGIFIGFVSFLIILKWLS